MPGLALASIGEAFHRAVVAVLIAPGVAFDFDPIGRAVTASHLLHVRLLTEVRDLLGDPARLDAMGTAMRSLARPDAAREAAEALLELAA